MSFLKFADAAGAELIESAVPGSFPVDVKKNGNKLNATITGTPQDF